MNDLIRRLRGRLFVASVVLVGSFAANAAVTDCIGMASDGQAICVAPDYQPTTYNTCVETGLSYPETALQNCKVSLGYTGPSYPSEGAVSAAINCAFGGGGGISWLAAGQTHVDGYLCWTRTVANVNGVEVRGWGHSIGSSWGVAILRDTIPYCKPGYTNVHSFLNGINELVACKSLCAADSYWSTAVNACVLNVNVPRSTKASSAESCPAPSTKNPGFGNPIYPLTGAKRETVNTGINIGGSPLVLTYDTARQLTPLAFGDTPSFGRLWLSNLHRNLVVSTGAKAVYAYRGNGAVLSFMLVNGVYVADTDINDQLQGISGGYLYTNATTQSVETYNAAGQLINSVDATGRKLSFTYSNAVSTIAPAAGYLTQVSNSDGRNIQFEYVLPAGGAALTDGKVSRVIDAYGRATVPTYDANGNLTAISWTDGQTRQFLYENAALPWALTGISDERNIRYATFGYDVAGRAVSTEHADGTQRYSVTYGTPPQALTTETLDLAARIHYHYYDWQLPTSPVITGPNNQAIDLTPTSALGVPLLAGASQPAGSGCAASNSASTFDANGNLISQDDFRGQRSCYAYDTKNRVTVSVEGLANTVDCSTVMPSSAVLPAGSRKTTTQWHPDWRLPAKVQVPGLVTTTVYNGQSDPFNGGTTASCSTGVLPSGKPLPLVCKQIRQATVDDLPGYVANVDIDGDFVQLLLHGDGLSGATTFADSSPSPKIVTPFGNTAVSTAQSKFGGASLYFDGSGDYLSIPSSTDFDLGNTYTIEAWINPSTVVGNKGVLSRSYYNAGAWDGLSFSIRLLGNTLRVYFYATTYTNEQFVDATIPVSASAWSHVAVVRSGSTGTVYVNGISAGTISGLNPALPSSQDLRIGNWNYPTAQEYFSGYIDEVRITKDVARYAASFTPQTQAYAGTYTVDAMVPIRTSTFNYDTSGRILSAIDPNNRAIGYAYYTDTVMNGVTSDTDTSLLLHADGVNGATAFTDSSLTPKAVTPSGNAQISTAQGKFGGASMAFDGTGDYLASSSSNDLDFGTGDFTIEWFEYPTSNANTGRFHIKGSVLGGTGTGAVAGVSVGYNGTNWAIYHGSTYEVTPATLSLNTWTHVALVRVGGVMRLFVGGNKVGPDMNYSAALPNTGAAVLTLGAYYDTTYSFTGYLDELRITKGIARYTANFSPPTAAFPNPVVVAANPNDVGHTVGDLQSVTNAAGMVTTFNSYDRAGRVRQSTDAKGVVTDTVYTPRGWISSVTVTPPGLAARTTSYTYDAAGQLTGVANPDGTSQSYSYDAAHRLIGASDNRGNTVTYTLDNMGNRISEQIKDPGGTLQRAISRSFDALNRLQQVSGAVQ